MHQEIPPSGPISIDTVKINPSLWLWWKNGFSFLYWTWIGRASPKIPWEHFREHARVSPFLYFALFHKSSLLHLQLSALPPPHHLLPPPLPLIFHTIHLLRHCQAKVDITDIFTRIIRILKLKYFGFNQMHLQKLKGFQLVFSYFHIFIFSTYPADFKEFQQILLRKFSNTDEGWHFVACKTTWGKGFKKFSVGGCLPTHPKLKSFFFLSFFLLFTGVGR